MLGLGANLGDPAAQLRQAVARLGRFATVRAVSSLYRSPPEGYAAQPDFLNVVVWAATAHPPEEVLAEALALERAFGRQRSFPNAPRPLDVDLLAYGDLVRVDPTLTLPHPRLIRRAFVLAPLAEIWPDWRHPVLGRTAAELWRDLARTAVLQRVGPPPWSP